MKIIIEITETKRPDGAFDVGMSMLAQPAPDPDSLACQIALALRERFLELAGLHAHALHVSPK